MTRLLSTRFRKRLLATLIIGVAGLVWGLMLLKLTLGSGLRLASYDLPFLFGEQPPPENIVLVHLDEASHQELDQPLAKAWDRRLHASLVERLNAAGARMIVFDILFHDGNSEQDAAFAAAIKKHGNVILAGEIVRTRSEVNIQQSLLLATPELRRAAAGWGLTDVPVDSDGVVRRIRHVIPTDFGDKPSLSDFVRQKLTGSGPGKTGTMEFLNYYGAAGSFPHYTYSGVLLDRGIPTNAFRDKIVIVGASQKSGLSDMGKDVFPTPYTPVAIEDNEGKKSRKLTPGMEIQATAIANLLENRRITSLPAEMEFRLIVAASFLLAATACLLPPVRGVLLCVGIGASIAVIAILIRQNSGIQFFWTIPAFGQMPLIAGLALGGHYFIEYSARWRLRRAFKSYMSEEQARQIDENDVSLELGGKEVEATILFSDLAGFTSMSEGLPPQAVSKALIGYFERTTEGILDNHGTIIKYIGDAVVATWGAPVKVDREADRAIEAAIQMQLASAKPILLETLDGTVEQVLETRVGINSGTVLAGNLGSSRRFDYTVIGDSVNTAARLEGLNKMLGTSILVSEAVLRKCVEPERFLKRRMGSFVVKGKKQDIVVFEILGFSNDPGSTIRKRDKDYLDFYQKGVDASLAGDIGGAEVCFRESLARHDRLPECPASRLHLDAIGAACSESREWRGGIVLDSK
ncbi:MAG: adenylate/guanylate cyclase domain-containing protein [Verrucomicrobiota bacterium]